MNPNMKMPMLEDNGFVLWESNAILFYLATRKPQSGLWPADMRRQADVLRWLAWQGAHWDAESLGMIAYEKASKMVIGLGPPDPAFVARGEQNFMRFASVLNESLKGRKWLIGEALTIADFSVAGLVPSAERVPLGLLGYPEIRRWYGRVASCRPGVPRWLQRTQQWPLGKPPATETVDLKRRTANSRLLRVGLRRSAPRR